MEGLNIEDGLTKVTRFKVNNNKTEIQRSASFNNTNKGFGFGADDIEFLEGNKAVLYESKSHDDIHNLKFLPYRNFIRGTMGNCW